jgi:hypothetical protein
VSLGLIYKAIHEQVLEGGYVQVGEPSLRDSQPKAARRVSEAKQTCVKYLAPGHGATKQGYLWVCAKPGSDAVFSWHTSRSTDCLTSLFPAGWSGKLQCDGYSAYPAFAREHNAAAQQERIELGACLAHVRREFYDARENAPRHAAWLLRQIANLYSIEKNLREQKAGPTLRGCDEKWNKRLNRKGSGAVSAPSAKGAYVERHWVSRRGRDGPATFASWLGVANSGIPL